MERSVKPGRRATFVRYESASARSAAAMRSPVRALSCGSIVSPSSDDAMMNHFAVSSSIT